MLFYLKPVFPSPNFPPSTFNPMKSKIVGYKSKIIISSLFLRGSFSDKKLLNILRLDLGNPLNILSLGYK